MNSDDHGQLAPLPGDRPSSRGLSVRQVRQLRAASLFAGALAAVVGGGVLFRLPESYWLPLCGVLGLAGLVFSLSNWKCPACAHRLSTRVRQTACPGCGLRLE